MLKKLWAILVVAIGLFCFAGNALASTTHHNRTQALSLYRPFPEGIDPNSAQRALAQVMSRASWDNQYAQVIAQQTGDSNFDSSHFTTLGYSSHAPAGTTNSALTGSGTVVPVADHGGSQFVKVLLVMNIVTKQTVALMVRCGNPRLHPFVKVLPWKPFQKGTVINVNRQVSKPVSINCPSGQSVTGTVTATVKGTIRARTWGKVQGNLNLKLQQAVDLQVKVFASLKCGAAPAPPPVKAACTLNGVPQPTVPPGMVVDIAGNCVQQSSSVNCPSGQFKDSAGSCVSIVVNCGNVDINGNNVTQGGNCNNTSTSPPPAQPTFQCTGLSLSNSNLSATATVSVSTTNGASFKSATVSWGDNNSTTDGLTQTHTYAAAGTFSVSAVVTFNLPNGTATANCSASITVSTSPPATCPTGTTGTPPNCVTPPSNCVTITSFIDLNDVPEGKTSGQLPFNINSCGSGSVTVDGGNGGVSKCDSNVKASSVPFDLSAGNNSLCVIYYAPGESTVTSGSITYTAIQGSAKDVKTDTFLITHPVRPLVR